MTTPRIAIAPMKVAQISKPGADFEIVERARLARRPGWHMSVLRVRRFSKLPEPENSGH